MSEEIKQKISKVIESHADWIFEIGESILRKPELGFREFTTSQLVQDKFRELNLSFKKDLSISGVRADLRGRSSNCKIAYFAELDALSCPEHPMADPVTGAAHACGHNVQIAVMLGVAQALVEVQASRIFGGDIAFIAVPAEELGQLDYRKGLRKQKTLSFLTGKQEMIATGILDDIDLSMMVHMQIPKEQGKLVTVGCSTNSALAKFTSYTGIASHAGSAPHLGINALNAALLGLQAINAQRETFRDEDSIRVHSIIAKGGTLVNSVPDDVRLETFVRANNIKAMMDASTKTDRAFRAGADAVGATVKIENLPGYMPLIAYTALDDVFEANAKKIFGAEHVGKAQHSNGSTDMGDVSQLMPTSHPFIHVVKGKMHGADFEIVDKYTAYIQTAKLVAWTLVDLLSGNAVHALNIKKSCTPPMSRNEWLEAWNSMTVEKF